MRNPIIRYVRNSAGKPFGCVVAIEEDNGMGFAIGWSQCNPKDQFIKKVARETALYRAKHGCKPTADRPCEPALIKDPLYGRVDWMNEAIYEMHLLAEERFLGREKDLLTPKAMIQMAADQSMDLLQAFKKLGLFSPEFKPPGFK